MVSWKLRIRDLIVLFTGRRSECYREQAKMALNAEEAT